MLSLQVNHLVMKRFLVIFFLTSAIALIFTSCERNCYCKNLDTNTESIYYGAYSRSECEDVEDSFNQMYNKETYDCTYK